MQGRFGKCFAGWTWKGVSKLFVCYFGVWLDGNVICCCLVERLEKFCCCLDGGVVFWLAGIGEQGLIWLGSKITVMIVILTCFFRQCPINEFHLILLTVILLLMYVRGDNLNSSEGE